MAVTSDGSYGVPEGLIFSFPCTVDADGRYEIVQGIELGEKARERIMASAAVSLFPSAILWQTFSSKESPSD